MKRLIPIFSIFVGFLWAILPNLSFAAEILNRSEVFIGVEKEYSENLYIGAVKSIVEGNLSEDLVIFGGEVKVTGNITGDVFLLGGKIDFSGKTFGDLRIVGGNVSISGEVVGDVLVLGGEVNILPGAVINKEIFAVGGSIIIENNSSAEIKMIGGKVFINGELSGASEITTQNLQISSNAKISGTFSYYAPNKINESVATAISGQMKFNEIDAIRDSGFIKKILLSFISFWYLLRFITTLILAFILVYVFKVFSQEVVDLARNSFWKSFLTGFLVIFFAPLLIVVSFISLVALPIGFLFMIAMTFITVISPAVSGIFVGNLLKKKFGDNQDVGVDFQGATFGVVALTGLQFVPVVGNWLIVLFTITSLGAICRYIRFKIIR